MASKVLKRLQQFRMVVILFGVWRYITALRYTEKETRFPIQAKIETNARSILIDTGKRLVSQIYSVIKLKLLKWGEILEESKKKDTK